MSCGSSAVAYNLSQQSARREYPQVLLHAYPATSDKHNQLPVVMYKPDQTFTCFFYKNQT